MTTTVSMWLGIAFVVLAIVAVVLQAWLWNPKYWDAVARKSHAPPFWMRVHRIVGWLYALLYVVMMIEMVPRLWEYEIELPPRTVVHATMAIAIGVILLAKIAILRFFRWFEEAMPFLGLALLGCTIVLATFSIPFAFRAHGSESAFEAANRERVRTILARLELGPGASTEALSTEASLRRGRDVVMQRCSQCHDLRTVLAHPRTGAGWLGVNRRMQDKPTFGRPLSDGEVLLATAYLVAITPVLQDSVRRQREEELARAEVEQAVIEPDAPDAGAPSAPDAGVEPLDAGLDAGFVGADAGVRRPSRRPRRDGGPGGQTDAGTRATSVAIDAGRPSAPPPQPEPAPLPYSAALGRQLVNERCTECHGMDDIESHGGDDRLGWSAVVRRMIAQGAELDADEARIVAQYLSATRAAR